MTLEVEPTGLDTANGHARSEPFGKLRAAFVKPPRPFERLRVSGVGFSAAPPDGTAQSVRAQVRATYAQRANRVLDSSSACGADSACDSVSRALYAAAAEKEVPELALRASLGSGDPVAAADLQPGEVVLDLGSGGGIDALLAARRVGPSGFVYGLDMTDEMLALAEQSRVQQGLTNIRFLKAYIEEIPLADETVEVVISNCVINLSPDKARVLHEAFRVLRPGGRFVVSDVVVRGTLPELVRREMQAQIGCVVGALEEGEYHRLLADAGFEGVRIEVTRVHALSPSGDGCREANIEACTGSADGSVVSGLVRARRPAVP